MQYESHHHKSVAEAFLSQIRRTSDGSLMLRLRHLPQTPTVRVCPLYNTLLLCQCMAHTDDRGGPKAERSAV